MTQQEWDGLLVECFYKHPDVPVWRLYDNYYQIMALRRIPQDWNANTTVLLFICSFMPQLARALWKRSIKDKDRIVAALVNSPIRVQKYSIDRFKRRRERADEKERREVLAADTLSWAARKSYREATSRSAWTTCKGGRR